VKEKSKFYYFNSGKIPPDYMTLRYTIHYTKKRDYIKQLPFDNVVLTDLNNIVALF